MEEVIKKEDNVSRTLESLFQSNKINNFLYPQSSSSSSSTNLSQLKFNSPTSSLSLSHEHLGLSSFTTPRQQVTMTQVNIRRNVYIANTQIIMFSYYHQQNLVKN